MRAAAWGELGIESGAGRAADATNGRGGKAFAAPPCHAMQVLRRELS